MTNSTLKFSAERFDYWFQGLGRAFYDSTATAPELPPIPEIPKVIEPAEQSKPLLVLAGGLANSVVSSTKPAVSVATRLKELLTGLKGLASAVGKATMIGGAIEGVASIVENIFKVYRGEEDKGKAVRHVATASGPGLPGAGWMALDPRGGGGRDTRLLAIPRTDPPWFRQTLRSRSRLFLAGTYFFSLSLISSSIRMVQSLICLPVRCLRDRGEIT
ncbi:MAG TPA: hypothetical protein V6C82_05560 [Chroococcales cyanobacterium]